MKVLKPLLRVVGFRVRLHFRKANALPAMRQG